MYCEKCGNKLEEKWVTCPYCGNIVSKEVETTVSFETNNTNGTNNAESNGKKFAEKNKWVSFLLCIFLGYFGAHKFYEGKLICGIVYLLSGGLFCVGWIIDCVVLLTKSNPYYVEVKYSKKAKKTATIIVVIICFLMLIGLFATPEEQTDTSVDNTNVSEEITEEVPTEEVKDEITSTEVTEDVIETETVDVIDEEIGSNDTLNENEISTVPTDNSNNSDISVDESTVYESEASENSLPIYSADYLNAFIEENDIDIKKSLNKSKMKKVFNDNSEGVYVKAEGDYPVKYSRTTETTEYIYVGDTKDNKPDGWGKIYKLIRAKETYENGKIRAEFSECYGYMVDEEAVPVMVLVYAGEFEEGYYSGYGWEYVTPFTSWDDLANSIYSRDLGANYAVVSDDIAQNVLYSCNPISYMGEFKKGKYHGNGIQFFYPIRELPEDYDEETIMYLFGYKCDEDIIIYEGEYKKGERNGESKEYIAGHLFYSGEIKHGERNGEGTIYFLGTDQIQYKGEWRSGKYHGKGTLYDESGEVIYKGKWDLGDYAS